MSLTFMIVGGILPDNVTNQARALPERRGVL
jgi:hypothetical protein